MKIVSPLDVAAVLVAMGELSQQERLFLGLRYGLNPGFPQGGLRTLEDVGRRLSKPEDELGLVETAILKKLSTRASR